MTHEYKKCTRATCPDCLGRGSNDDSDSSSYCSTCHGSGTTNCCGCRRDSGMDCTYEALSFCEVCGGMEGSLLPFCPGRRLSIEEDQANYAQYCAGTGPFAKCTLETVTEAIDAVLDRNSQGSCDLLDALLELKEIVDAS